MTARIGRWPESAQRSSSARAFGWSPLIRYPYRVFYQVADRGLRFCPAFHHAAGRRPWDGERYRASDEETSGDAQRRAVALSRRVFERGGDVAGFQQPGNRRGFLAARSGREQVEHVLTRMRRPESAATTGSRPSKWQTETKRRDLTSPCAMFLERSILSSRPSYQTTTAKPRQRDPTAGPACRAHHALRSTACHFRI